MPQKISFASDNNSGIHPQILKALADANTGHYEAYGADAYTEKCALLFKDIFGLHTESLLVYNGTGANIIALKSAAQSFHSVITAATAHIYEDECSAPENFTGCKLIPVQTETGKLMPDDVKQHLVWLNDEHRAQPRVVSITQSSEMGTVYTKEEIETLADYCHQNNLYLHMDGARISNAAVALNMDFKSFTTDAGVDILSFGGTKNGLLFGEVVVWLNAELAKNARYFRKQAAQLHSKMRYIAAQYIAYFQNDLWRTNAENANKMAQLLRNKINTMLSIQPILPTQANGIFAIIPQKIIKPLQAEFPFYIFDEHKHLARWMCAFDTAENDVQCFAKAIEQKLTIYNK